MDSGHGISINPPGRPRGGELSQVPRDATQCRTPVGGASTLTLNAGLRHDTRLSGQYDAAVLLGLALQHRLGREQPAGDSWSFFSLGVRLARTGSYPSNPVATFDSVTAVGDARTLQFGLRLSFQEGPLLDLAPCRPDLPPPSPIRGPGCCRGSAVRPFESSHLEVLGGWLRGDVVIERARFSPANMVGEHHADHDLLMPVHGTTDPDAVTFPDDAVRLGSFAVHVDLATFAGPLGLRACLAEAADVEPDVEANAVRGRGAQMRISTLPFAVRAFTSACV